MFSPFCDKPCKPFMSITNCFFLIGIIKLIIT